METQRLQAEIRSETGKGAARRLRSSGRLPAVIYGLGEAPASLSVSPVELRRALSTEFGRNVLIELSVAGNEQIAMTKEVQVDPVSRDLLHVDFYRVDPSLPVEVRVPFRTTGRAKGVLAGGEMNVVFRNIPVRAKPDDIPSFLEGDVTELEINDMLRARDLKLPEGVRTLLAPDQTVVAVIAERKKEEVEAVAAAEGEEKPEGEGEAEGEGKAEAADEKKKPEAAESGR
jgi:large subunit ribosomal protein L25